MHQSFLFLFLLFLRRFEGYHSEDTACGCAIIFSFWDKTGIDGRFVAQAQDFQKNLIPLLWEQKRAGASYGTPTFRLH